MQKYQLELLFPFGPPPPPPHTAPPPPAPPAPPRRPKKEKDDRDDGPVNVVVLLVVGVLALATGVAPLFLWQCNKNVAVHAEAAPDGRLLRDEPVYHDVGAMVL